MPSAWSWYQIVAARFSFGYWKTAKPGPHPTPKERAALASKKWYQVPFLAYAGGMFLAFGRYHASA